LVESATFDNFSVTFQITLINSPVNKEAFVGLPPLGHGAALQISAAVDPEP
jgi:hypothetical protein